MTDTIKDFGIQIVGLDEIDDELIDSISHAVSLVDPGTRLPFAIYRLAIPNRLLVEVHDAFADDLEKVPPSATTIANLLKFANGLINSNISQLLVHCHMGRSRSPAAAAIILVALGHSPLTAFQKICSARKPIWPNWSLVELGDQALHCNGELKKACEQVYHEIRKEFPCWVEDPKPENAHNDSLPS